MRTQRLTTFCSGHRVAGALGRPCPRVPPCVLTPVPSLSRNSLIAELLGSPRLKQTAIVRMSRHLMNATFALAVLLNVLLLMCRSSLTENDSSWEFATCDVMFGLGFLHAALSVLRMMGLYTRSCAKWLNHDSQQLTPIQVRASELRRNGTLLHSPLTPAA